LTDFADDWRFSFSVKLVYPNFYPTSRDMRGIVIPKLA
jgi:hypothetical protein